MVEWIVGGLLAAILLAIYITAHQVITLLWDIRAQTTSISDELYELRIEQDRLHDRLGRHLDRIAD